MTWIDVVREEAAKVGKTVTDAEAEDVLWNWTGFPDFWPDATKTPEEWCRLQVQGFFQQPTPKKSRRRRSA